MAKLFLDDFLGQADCTVADVPEQLAAELQLLAASAQQQVIQAQHLLQQAKEDLAYGRELLREHGLAE